MLKKTPKCREFKVLIVCDIKVHVPKVTKVTMKSNFKMSRIASKLQNSCSTMASSFRTVMVASMGIIVEYV